MISGRERALSFFSNPPQKLFRAHGSPCNTASSTPDAYENIAKMKLDVKNIRYLSATDWRVLTSVCARTLRVPVPMAGE